MYCDLYIVALVLYSFLRPQETILWLFDSVSNSSLLHNASQNVSRQTDAQSKDKLLRILEGKISYDVKLIFGEDDVRKSLSYLLNSCEMKRINMDVNMQMLDALVSELLVFCKLDHNPTN